MSDDPTVPDTREKLRDEWDKMHGRKWIPVSERLPENDTLVLASYWDAESSEYWIETTLYSTTAAIDDHWSCDASVRHELGTPTHWMPLPEPPPAE